MKIAHVQNERVDNFINFSRFLGTGFFSYWEKSKNVSNRVPQHIICYRNATHVKIIRAFFRHKKCLQTKKSTL